MYISLSCGTNLNDNTAMFYSYTNLLIRVVGLRLSPQADSNSMECGFIRYQSITEKNCRPA